MPTTVTVSLADQVGKIARGLSRGANREYERTRPQMFLAMAAVAEAVVQENFDQQKTPTGQAMLRISPLTLLIRKVTGIPGNKAGIGKGFPLRQSLMLGGPGNVYRATRNGFIFGSNLRRGKKNSLVLKTFQLTYTMPKSAGGPARGPARGRQAAAGDRIRGWMFMTVGIRAPRRGRVLVHPARPVLGHSRRQDEAMLRVGRTYIENAISRTYASAAQQAGAIRTALRERRPQDVGGVQFF